MKRKKKSLIHVNDTKLQRLKEDGFRYCFFNRKHWASKMNRTKIENSLSRSYHAKLLFISIEEFSRSIDFDNFSETSECGESTDDFITNWHFSRWFLKWSILL